MSRKTWVVVGLWLLSGRADAADAPRLEARPQQLSYALGVSMARTLARQRVEVDADLLARGLKDGLAGGPLLLDEAQLKGAIGALQVELRERVARSERSAADARARGEAFLKENAGKAGVVTLPSGLQYRILEAGAGPIPADGDQVRCHYRGTLLDGTTFDDTFAAGRPAAIKVAKAIPGWREALKLMPVGSRWQLFVPPELAYGERGQRGRKSARGRIGPNATLIFEAQLLAIDGPTTASRAQGR